MVWVFASFFMNLIGKINKLLRSIKEPKNWFRLTDPSLGLAVMKKNVMGSMDEPIPMVKILTEIFPRGTISNFQGNNFWITENLKPKLWWNGFLIIHLFFQSIFMMELWLQIIPMMTAMILQVFVSLGIIFLVTANKRKYYLIVNSSLFH